MSQTALGNRLGITFQQVQKYERGANRLSASALWRAADAVEVSITFCYEGLSRGHAVVNPVDADVLRLTQRIRKLEPAVREKLSALIAVIGRENPRRL
jgi:transcriptional regulator with XRE-family HTH domain